MSDLERLDEALANEGVVWRVLDGDHDDYIQAHDAFAVFAELVEEYRDLLAAFRFGGSTTTSNFGGGIDPPTEEER